MLHINPLPPLGNIISLSAVSYNSESPSHNCFVMCLSLQRMLTFFRGAVQTMVSWVRVMTQFRKGFVENQQRSHVSEMLNRYLNDL